MRTNIDIDDRLMNEAMKLTNVPTKKGVVEYALEECIKMHKRRGISQLKGKLHWEGSLDDMRITG